jgi:hypothetical protein
MWGWTPPLRNSSGFGRRVADAVRPMKMALSKELAVMANDTALIKAQTDINQEQAKSSSVFVSGSPSESLKPSLQAYVDGQKTTTDLLNEVKAKYGALRRG